MLKTSVERLEGNQIKLTVTVPAEDVSRFIDTAYKNAASKYRLPGFRKGKAPRPIIDAQLGRDLILMDATEDTVNTTYPKALDAERLRPIDSPEIEEIGMVADGEEFTYEAQVELRPELPLSKTEGFEVEVPTKQVFDSEVQVQVDQLRDQFASLEPVEDRGIASGDFLLISFVGTVDGEPYEGNVVDKYLYEMNRGLMPEQFDDGLIGAKPGDEVRIEFEIPETGSNPEFAGKTAGFDVTVHEVKAKKLPDVDDEFASNVGGFESVDEMMDSIRKRLELTKDANYERIKERMIRQAIAEHVEGDIPPQMVDSRKGEILRDFQANLESRGTTVEQYMAATGTDPAILEADIGMQALASVREDLALEALFRAKGMEVTDSDVEVELAEIAQATGTTTEEARERWDELGLIPVVIEQIMRRRAYEWLLENVTIKETTPDDAAPTDAGTKKAPKKKAAAKKEDEGAKEAAPKKKPAAKKKAAEESTEE